MSKKNKNQTPADPLADLGVEGTAETTEVVAEAPEVAEEAAPEAPEAPEVAEVPEPVKAVEASAKPDRTARPEKKGREGTVIMDAKGNALFKRLKASSAQEEKKKERALAAVQKPAKQLSFAVNGVSANSARLEFPTDKWGLTKDVKKAMIAMASRIAGDDSKKELADEVLRILNGHLEEKFASDKKHRDRLREGSAEPVAE